MPYLPIGVVDLPKPQPRPGGPSGIVGRPPLLQGHFLAYQDINCIRLVNLKTGQSISEAAAREVALTSQFFASRHGDEVLIRTQDQLQLPQHVTIKDAFSIAADRHLLSAHTSAQEVIIYDTRDASQRRIADFRLDEPFDPDDRYYAFDGAILDAEGQASYHILCARSVAEGRPVFEMQIRRILLGAEPVYHFSKIWYELDCKTAPVGLRQSSVRSSGRPHEWVLDLIFPGQCHRLLLKLGEDVEVTQMPFLNNAALWKDNCYVRTDKVSNNGSAKASLVDQHCSQSTEAPSAIEVRNLDTDAARGVIQGQSNIEPEGLGCLIVNDLFLVDYNEGDNDTRLIVYTFDKAVTDCAVKQLPLGEHIHCQNKSFAMHLHKTTHIAIGSSRCYPWEVASSELFDKAEGDDDYHW